MDIQYIYRDGDNTNINIGSYSTINGKVVTISHLAQLSMYVGADYYDDASSLVRWDNNLYIFDSPDNLVRSREQDAMCLMYNDTDSVMEIPVYERTADQPKYIVTLQPKELALMQIADYSGAGHLVASMRTNTQIEEYVPPTIVTISPDTVNVTTQEDPDNNRLILQF